MGVWVQIQVIKTFPEHVNIQLVMSGSGGDADLASSYVATLHLSVRPAAPDALFVPVFMPKKDQEVFVSAAL